jgi:hypothetical protein
MNKISMRLGGNHWLILVMLATYLSRVAYKTASMPGIGRLVVVFFVDYGFLAFILTHCFIFQSEGLRLAADPPLKPQWKRWFFILYIPHVIYSLWYAVWMTAVHHAPQCILVSALMLFALLCAYLRLSVDDT